jgi:hypothetical protein
MTAQKPIAVNAVIAIARGIGIADGATGAEKDAENEMLMEMKT